MYTCGRVKRGSESVGVSNIVVIVVAIRIEPVSIVGVVAGPQPTMARVTGH